MRGLKEMAVAYFKVGLLSETSLGQIEEDHENLSQHSRGSNWEPSEYRYRAA
jgi:hypothetical protein